MLSAGGFYAAWEIGVWKALRGRIAIDMIVGASAGAWNGWAIAGGASIDDLAAEWLDPRTAELMEPGLHAHGILRFDALHRKARDLRDRFHPQMHFGLTMVELPWLRTRLVRDGEVGWEHLAATASIPFGFPPVRIAGRDYVDGGLLGALPLWAAEAMGADCAIGVNALVNPTFRLLHRLLRPRRPGRTMRVRVIEPAEPLGGLRDTVVWSRGNIERWIAMGERDGIRALTSITM